MIGLKGWGPLAWSQVIKSLHVKSSDWSDCSRIIGCEMTLIRSFLVVCSWEEVEKIVPLASRGVRVLMKCSRRQIEVVATQTTLKGGHEAW